ncbi:MAG TPA: glycosyltransferase family A protein [Candidatus Cybelea sp.]|jgi:glycosyltransferase involved in cell wall biosynthesis
MEFSVVIATKDRRDFLAGALESLQAQADAPPFEVIVVDNGSTDGTRAEVEAYANASRPVRYLWQPEPNRGKSRNRGVEAALGRYIAFCDDDVRVPAGWLAAHAAAQTGDEYVVNGPILNVASVDVRPKPAPANYSRAFLCTCNASLAKHAFERAGGFDESFDLYGWEDTELGVRLRESGCRWRFAWSAYLWHLKPDVRGALEVEAAKALEKARMASRFLAKHPSRRARLATGAHPLNLFRARYLLPEALLAYYAGISKSSRVPAWLRALSRGQLLDGLYARELVRALDAEHER